jgi:ubiquinone/menaquinone biosynthesis C-methylase UbiE
MFRHEHAHMLDDPERQTWLPVAPLIRRLDIAPGMRIADVGAGTGYFALPMARAVAPGGQVFAVDIQPEMLEHLRSRLEPGLPVTLVQGEATRTTLEDGAVNLALLANVWHEIDDRDASLTEMERILRPGGCLAILDWRPDVEHPPGPPTEHRIAASAVQSALRARRWKVEKPEPAGRFSYLVLATRPDGPSA